MERIAVIVKREEGRGKREERVQRHLRRLSV